MKEEIQMDMVKIAQKILTNPTFLDNSELLVKEIQKLYERALLFNFLEKNHPETLKKNTSATPSPTTKKVEKETVKSETGEELSFKKSWGKYDFTDEEIEKLKNGEEIKIGPFKNKKKKEYYVKGKLGWGTFKGKKYYGFQAEFV